MRKGAAGGREKGGKTKGNKKQGGKKGGRVAPARQAKNDGPIEIIKPAYCVAAKAEETEHDLRLVRARVEKQGSENATPDGALAPATYASSSPVSALHPRGG